MLNYFRESLLHLQTKALNYRSQYLEINQTYDGNKAKVSSHKDETNLSCIQNRKASIIADIKKQEERAVKLQGFISRNHQSALNMSDGQENGQDGKSTSPDVCLRIPAVSSQNPSCIRQTALPPLR